MTEPTEPGPSGQVERKTALITELRSRPLAPYREGGYVLRVAAIAARTGGGLRSWPVAVTQHAGQRYLTAPNRAREWVADLLAAGDCMLEETGGTRHYDAVLAGGDTAAQVVAVYLAASDRISPLWPVARGASAAEIRTHTHTIAVIRLLPGTRTSLQPVPEQHRGQQ
jgi:hypothetical protein